MPKNYKYFVCHKDDDHRIKLLHIKLPRMKAYVKRYDQAFLIEDDEL